MNVRFISAVSCSFCRFWLASSRLTWLRSDATSSISCSRVVEFAISRNLIGQALDPSYLNKVNRHSQLTDSQAVIVTVEAADSSEDGPRGPGRAVRRDPARPCGGDLSDGRIGGNGAARRLGQEIAEDSGGAAVGSGPAPDGDISSPNRWNFFAEKGSCCRVGSVERGICNSGFGVGWGSNVRRQVALPTEGTRMHS